jgi:hypothetical protein
MKTVTIELSDIVCSRLEVAALASDMTMKELTVMIMTAISEMKDVFEVEE